MQFSNHMKVCLLGATGFLGRSIGERLTALDIPWAGVARSSIGANTHIIPLHETTRLAQLIEEYPLVINALGSLKPGDFVRDLDGAMSLFLQTLEQLEDVLLSSSIERMVHISSAGTVYGEAGDKPSTEEDRLRPKSWYGRAKVMEECRLMQIADKKGFAYACARVSNPYGNAGALNHGFLDVLIGRIRSGKTFEAFFPMQATRDFIHATDMAEMVVSLAASREEGVFNIGRGVPTSLGEMLDFVEKLWPKAKIIRSACFTPTDVIHSATSTEKYVARFGPPATVAPEPLAYIEAALTGWENI
jgi:UDP-glucose 4-epimerase